MTALTLEDGTPIDPQKSYTAVVNNFMAAGGDNYKVLLDAKTSLAGPIDLDVFYKYIIDTFKGGDIQAKKRPYQQRQCSYRASGNTDTS